MKIEIIGGGSVGLLLAGRLAAAAGSGVSVLIVPRTSRQAEAIAAKGITVRDKEGHDPRIVPVSAMDFAAYTERPTGQAEEVHWILLALKQKDIGLPVIEGIRRQATPDTRLCCLQNGMGHLEKLQAAVGAGRLYAAVTTVGALRVSDTEVWHTGIGTTRIGAAAAGHVGADPQAALLAEVLCNAGLDTAVSGNIQADIWDKLIINTVVNPLTALLDIRNGRLLDHPRCMELMRSLFEEAEAAAAAAGYGREGSSRWDWLIEVCRATAGNRSSMLQDLGAGRPTELEWLTGSLLREAERHGLRLPFHEAVYRLVKAKEALQTSPKPDLPKE